MRWFGSVIPIKLDDKFIVGLISIIYLIISYFFLIPLLDLVANASESFYGLSDSIIHVS